jgi:hypothetical protein
MDRQSPTFVDFNPTGDRRVTIIKSGVDALIEFIRAETASSGPETKRRASISITGLEQASMWGVKALFSSDAVRGDDGGSGTGEPAAREPDFDPKTGRDNAPSDEI